MDSPPGHQKIDQVTFTNFKIFQPRPEFSLKVSFEAATKRVKIFFEKIESHEA